MVIVGGVGLAMACFFALLLVVAGASSDADKVACLAWEGKWTADYYLRQGAGGMKIARLGSRTWFLR